MYIFKKEQKTKILEGRTITYIANKIGVTIPFLTSVLNGKRTCSKLVAFCITKYIDNNSEIEKYFELKGE